MSAPVRPSSLFRAAAQATAPSGVLGTIPNPPPEIAQLSAGTTVRGVVVGQDGRGHVLVRTELGTLAVATKAQLAVGSEVTLQIRSSGAQLHILIMQSQTQTAGAPDRGAQPGPPAVVPGAAGAPAPRSGFAGPPDVLTLGQTVKAVLQTPATGPGNTAGAAPGGGADRPAELPRLAPGSELRLRILRVDSPAAQGQGPQGQGSDVQGAQGKGTQGSGRLGTGRQGQAAGQGAMRQAATPATTPPAGTPAPVRPANPPGSAGPPATAYAGLSRPVTGPSSVARASPPGPATGAPAAAPSASAAASGQSAAAPPGGGALQAGATAAHPGAGPGGRPMVASGQAKTPSIQPAGAAGQAMPAAPGQPVPAVRGQPGRAAVAQPPIGATNPEASGAAFQLPGRVTATTNGGQPVLQTPVGTMTLDVRAPLPAGSRILLELSAGALEQPVSAATPDRRAAPKALARSWPALEEAVRVLQSLGGPAGTTAIAPPAIPQPGPKLASGLLFFLAALSGGQLSGWLGGQTAQALKDAGRAGLLARLGRDFGQLSRFTEPADGEWRLFPIPLFDGGRLDQLRLFLRRRHHGRGTAGGGEADEATRFVLEVELSRLGDLQLDGLVRDKRFDLILRTRRPLPEDMRHDITEIFRNANDATGYTGNIGFQASPDWHFIPIEEAAAAASHSIVA